MVDYGSYVVLLSPKAASTSLRVALGGEEPLLRWSLLSQVKSESETVAIVREPLDWLVSWYRYLAYSVPEGSPPCSMHLSFEQFVDRWIKQGSNMWQVGDRQAVHLTHNDKRVDHLFRFDALDKLEEFLGVSLPHHNASFNRNVEITERSRQLVADHFSEDQALFDEAIQ